MLEVPSPSWVNHSLPRHKLRTPYVEQPGAATTSVAQKKTGREHERKRRPSFDSRGMIRGESNVKTRVHGVRLSSPETACGDRMCRWRGETEVEEPSEWRPWSCSTPLIRFSPHAAVTHAYYATVTLWHPAGLIPLG
ncbi:hypothetical protein DPEC_G00226850 [Dallia pectoralis]|uniref:Uncharacterized protein n=1 Tax=Dallia pectoralis TaxID=75939 RepID=A0ACC2G156_DALPE|nr:hypothetical protein DPEC_G00226850 [Dallia pectoralis]